MTNEKRQSYVESIARHLGCVINQGYGTPGMMYVEEAPPRVEGPVITEQKDYLIMLHELGHVAYGHTQGRPPFEDRKFYFENGVLRSECQAWNYALRVCDEELEDATRAFMWDVCLGSYYRGAKFRQGQTDCRLLNGNRHHVTFEYDEPDMFFWATYDALAGPSDSPRSVEFVKTRNPWLL